MGGTTVSLILPTYNEIENIQLVIDRILKTIEKTPYRPEVLVMDDDSPDGTWKYAKNLYVDDERVRITRRKGNFGLSKAVTEGFDRATGKFCAVLDADLQHPPERLPELFAELSRGADIAIGSRYKQEGGIENWSMSRRFVSKGATAAAKISVPAARKLTDPLSGFFAVRRSTVNGVLLEPHGYKILMEILAKCDIDTVSEVPYVFSERERGESNLELGEYQRFLEHTVGLLLLTHGFGMSRTPMRMVRAIEFSAVGATGIGVNMLVFWLLGVISDIYYLFAGAGAFFAAVNWNFFGNWAITFNRPEKAVMDKLVKFYFVSLIGYVGYTTLLALFVGLIELPSMIGNVGAIIGASVINFFGTDSFVFDTDDSVAEMSIESINQQEVNNR